MQPVDTAGQGSFVMQWHVTERCNLRCSHCYQEGQVTPELPFDDLLTIVEQFKALRHLALGDFYPLLPHTFEPDQWSGYQFHRGDIGEGMALLFRDAESPYVAVDIELRRLDPKATYELTFEDTGEQRRAPGAELSQPTRITIEDSPGSALLTYRRVGVE